MSEERPAKTGKQGISSRRVWARRAFKAIALVAVILLVHFGAAALSSFREKRRHTGCLSNIKHIGLAMHMYASEHDDRLPRTPRWEAQIYPAFEKNRQVLTCPGDHSEGSARRFHYAMTLRFSGLEMSQHTDRAGSIIVYDADAAGRPDPRHNRQFRGADGWRYWKAKWWPEGGLNCAFMDGHAKWMAGIPDQIATGPYAAPISQDDEFWRGDP